MRYKYIAGEYKHKIVDSTAVWHLVRSTPTKGDKPEYKIDEAGLHALVDGAYVLVAVPIADKKP